MIHEKELRIGNFVKYNKFPDTLYSIRSVSADRIHPIELIEHSNNEIYAVNLDGLSDIEPIPLTKELLLQYGFKEDISQFGGFLIAADEGEYIRIIDDEIHGWHWPMNGYTRPKVNYLHQLQNFYYALTGKELTPIK